MSCRDGSSPRIQAYPAVIILDEIGYCPSTSAEPTTCSTTSSAPATTRDPIILTTNKAFWPTIFNGDSTITTVFDRHLHYGNTVVLEGSSFRMKDRAESCRKNQPNTSKNLPDRLIYKPLIPSEVHAAPGKLAFQRAVWPNGLPCVPCRTVPAFRGLPS